MRVARKVKKPYRVATAGPTPAIWKCLPCGYIYNDGSKKTRFADLDDSYRCPLCSARRDAFVRLDTGG